MLAAQVLPHSDRSSVQTMGVYHLTCSPGVAITKKDSDDDDSDDDVHLWPEYLARKPSTNRSKASTEPPQQQPTSLVEPQSNRNDHHHHRGKLGCVDSVDHRNDHLHRLCPDRPHSLLTALNSNREFLAHAVLLDDSSGPTEPPCSSVLQFAHCGTLVQTPA